MKEEILLTNKKLFIALFGALMLLAVGCTSTQQTNTETTPSNTENNNTTVNEEVNNDEQLENEASEIDTSDWKTYTNEEYGFSFQYPNDWDIEERKEKIPENVLISITLWPKSLDRENLFNNHLVDNLISISIENEAKKIEDSYTAPFGVYNESTITVAGRLAAKMNSDINKDQTATIVYLPVVEKNYGINFLARELDTTSGVDELNILLESFNISK